MNGFNGTGISFLPCLQVEMEIGFRQYMGVSSDDSKTDSNDFSSLMVDIDLSKKGDTIPEVVEIIDDSGLVDPSRLSLSRSINESAGSISFATNAPSDTWSSTPCSAKVKPVVEESNIALKAELALMRSKNAELGSQLQKMYNKLNQAVRDKKCGRYCSKGIKYKELIAKKLERYVFVEKSELERLRKQGGESKKETESLLGLIEKGEEDIATALSKDE